MDPHGSENEHSGDSDEEGSLVDFIVHDSGEDDDDDDDDDATAGDDDDDDDDEESGGGGEDDEAEHEERDGEGDGEGEGDGDGDGDGDETDDAVGDQEILSQYTADMENLGMVLVDGVRRSCRLTKGQAPIRYVDPDYIELMLEDTTTAELHALAAEESDAGDDENSMSSEDDEDDDYDMKEEEEEEEDSDSTITSDTPQFELVSGVHDAAQENEEAAITVSTTTSHVTKRQRRQ